MRGAVIIVIIYYFLFDALVSELDAVPATVNQTWHGLYPETPAELANNDADLGATWKDCGMFTSSGKIIYTLHAWSIFRFTVFRNTEDYTVAHIYVIYAW